MQQCRLSLLKERFEHVHSHIDQDGGKIEKYVITFMLYVLGLAIFLCKNKEYAFWYMYFHTLKDLFDVKNYAFGAAILAQSQKRRRVPSHEKSFLICLRSIIGQ